MGCANCGEKVISLVDKNLEPVDKIEENSLLNITAKNISVDKEIKRRLGL